MPHMLFFGCVIFACLVFGTPLRVLLCPPLCSVFLLCVRQFARAFLVGIQPHLARYVPYKFCKYRIVLHGLKLVVEADFLWSS